MRIFSHLEFFLNFHTQTSGFTYRAYMQICMQRNFVSYVSDMSHIFTKLFILYDLKFLHMRVYLLSNAEYRDFFSSVHSFLEKKGYIPCSRVPLGFDHKTGHIRILLHEVSSNIDLVVCDTKQFSAEELGSISHAISRRIPVLCLHERGKLIPEIIGRILSDSNIKRRFKLLVYDMSRLNDQLEKSVDSWNCISTKNTAICSKFTLRLPVSLGKLLDQYADKTRQSKAMVIRKMMEEKFVGDQEKSM